MSRIKAEQEVVELLYQQMVRVIGETNGISIADTLELLSFAPQINQHPELDRLLKEFRRLLAGYHQSEVEITTLLSHPCSEALSLFFHRFPLRFYEEHIHLTGSLTAEFIYPRLKRLLEGKKKAIYRKKIVEVYGKDALPINGVEDVERLITLKKGEQFSTYLRILYLTKLILNTKKAHQDAAYHMASHLYDNFNIGHLRLKFTLSRISKMSAEEIPGLDRLKEEDVVLGLFDGMMKFQKEHPDFTFTLSPSFRKEEDFFDQSRFESKEEHFLHQVQQILDILDRHPRLAPFVTEVDTVGEEVGFHRKKHFSTMKRGLRRLQYRGFKIRSHHGESWPTLRQGIQAVDNAMNIWHINTLEHGLSLGINPNYYFHRFYQRVVQMNLQGEAISRGKPEYAELMDLEWGDDRKVRDKLIKGGLLTPEEQTLLLKTKFYTAREIEHYQHDVLNRMIQKQVSLVALPSSNLKLTGRFPDYKDHPFSWWEKKGVKLGVGTDNFVTLNTNFIKELLILLFSDQENLKITKLLMVATREERRPLISRLLWQMRKKALGQ
jgi:adenosine deaminase